MVDKLKYISYIIILLLINIGLFRDITQPIIEEKLRDYGFNGQIEIYKGYVPCEIKEANYKANGCYNFQLNIIRINNKLWGRKLDFTIAHEICHWKYQERNEIKTDKCADKLIK